MQVVNLNVNLSFNVNILRLSIIDNYYEGLAKIKILKNFINLKIYLGIVTFLYIFILLFYIKLAPLKAKKYLLLKEIY